MHISEIIKGKARVRTAGKKAAADDDEKRKRQYEERAKKVWSRIAKEPIEVELIKGALYAFGSELAMLRLYREFTLGKLPKFKADFSPNEQRWYFRSET